MENVTNKNKTSITLVFRKKHWEAGKQNVEEEDIPSLKYTTAVKNRLFESEQK